MPNGATGAPTGSSCENGMDGAAPKSWYRASYLTDSEKLSVGVHRRLTRPAPSRKSPGL